MKWLLIILFLAMVLNGVYLFYSQHELNEKVCNGVMQYKNWQAEQESVKGEINPSDTVWIKTRFTATPIPTLTPTPGIIQRRFNYSLNEWYFIDVVTGSRVTPTPAPAPTKTPIRVFDRKIGNYVVVDDNTGLKVLIARDGSFTPTPTIDESLLELNAASKEMSSSLSGLSKSLSELNEAQESLNVELRKLNEIASQIIEELNR
jgi:hypothetical protein